ncbi:hypothetical protein [Mycoplasmoides alvi]|uniref:hypothetical protein n=1 Tax=Mycoplasmoides alvi TaxID=78580 RepID=UPI00051ACA45|nr:hypothetical protein [Mycoplasmoides alvi]
MENEKINEIEQKVIDLANKQNNKPTNKLIVHLKKFIFLYLNLLMFSILIIVVGICIAAGLQLI